MMQQQTTTPQYPHEQEWGNKKWTSDAFPAPRRVKPRRHLSFEYNDRDVTSRCVR
jgi:hypothetical protein